VAFSPEVDAVLDQVPLRAFSGETDAVLSQTSMRFFSTENDAELEQIPLRAFAAEVDAVFAVLVAAVGPVSDETFNAETLPPLSEMGPLLSHEVFIAETLPPATVMGVVELGEEYAEEPPLPPVPPPPPVVVGREPSLADDALVREFSQAVNESVTIQGGPQLTASYLNLNSLTPAQYDFLARRQAGADGAIPQARVGRFTGPAYPFGPSWALTLGPKTDLEVIFTSIANIITTYIGSLPYAPFRGSDIPNLVFEPNDAINQGLLRYYTRRDLSRQEPRAQIRTVRTIVPVEDPHRVVVTSAFQIVGDPDGRVFSAPIEYNTANLAT
jgi:phage baseplate assembly protein W